MALKARMNTDATDTGYIKDWLNQVYAQVCVETEFFENDGSATATPTANASSIAYPSTLLRLDYVNVTYGGQSYGPMKPVPFDEILRLRQGTSASGGPPLKFAVVYQTIEFWPNAVGSETFTYYGSKLPTALSAAGDTPILQEPYASKLLEYGALAEAADYKSDPQEQEYRQLFEMWLQKFRAHVNKRRGAGTTQLAVEGTRLYPPHDPSTDLRDW